LASALKGASSLTMMLTGNGDAFVKFTIKAKSANPGKKKPSAPASA